MKRLALFGYGLVVYAFFLATFLYAVGFVGNVRFELWDGFTFVPKSMDVGGESSSAIVAIAVDALLLGIFAIQHSGMARLRFKRAWTKIIPREIERSTYVLASSAALALLFWLWRPIGSPVWIIEGRGSQALLATLCFLGWGTVLAATFHIDHFALFGLRQVYCALRRRELPPSLFTTPGLYRLVRHPIYLGFVVAFWATPLMTLGHLVFAVATTGYILVAIRWEERDLVRELGATYERYRDDVPMLAPGLKRRATPKRASIEP